MRTGRPVASSAALLIAAGLAASCAGNKAAAPHANLDHPTAIISGEPAPAPPIPMGDPKTLARIIDEGQNRNQVMNHLKWLSDQGPRLTGSTRVTGANIWAREQFESWGLDSSLHQWGEVKVRFDRGPSSAKILTRVESKKEDGSVEVTWKDGREVVFTTLAWTHGTDGPVRGSVVRMPETEEEYAKAKDSLKGAWVLIKAMPAGGRQGVRGPGAMAGERMAHRKEAREKVAQGADPATLPIDERVIFDGINGFISAPRDDKDRVWTTALPKWRDKTLADIPPDVEVICRLSDYDYMNSRLADGDAFQIEINAANELIAGPFPVYNTIAEIRGTERPDEVVIVCGHMDSWDGPGSQGTTDNGTGSSVTLEAARILAAVGARPRRTIRFCLWTGEEQGLLGSKQYVQDIREQWPRISAVLNDDGGTNYEGGLKCTVAQADMLAAATAPVNNLFTDTADGKPMTVNIQPKGEKPERFAGSDHASFVEVGIPGFFWDEVGRADYGFGWHTQNDRYTLAVPEYLMQSSTCAAITAYNLACAPDLLPRWSMEPAAPEPAKPATPKAEPSKPDPSTGTPPSPPPSPAPSASSTPQAPAQPANPQTVH